jgi:hypothetical protein
MRLEVKPSFQLRSTPYKDETFKMAHVRGLYSHFSKISIWYGKSGRLNNNSSVHVETTYQHAHATHGPILVLSRHHSPFPATVVTFVHELVA